jgi:hypothetical protein
MNKSELKQRIKELELELELVKQQAGFDNLNLVSARADKSRLEKENHDMRDKLTAWGHVGNRLVYMIAYDLAANRTHRERNEQMRLWFRILQDAVQNIYYVSSMDDIPF